MYCYGIAHPAYYLKKAPSGWVFSWHVINIINSHWCKYHPCLPINMVLLFIVMKMNVC